MVINKHTLTHPPQWDAQDINGKNKLVTELNIHQLSIN
jgi:hypothetical protein